MQSVDRTGVRRRILPVVLVGLAGLALAACGSSEAGAAATLGDTRITESELAHQVELSLEAKGQSPDTPDAELQAQTLTQMLRTALVDDLAARSGIAVTQGMVDQALAGVASNQGTDVDGLYASLASQGYAPSQVTSLVRVNLEAQQLGLKLAPNGAPEDQQAALLAALADLSDELDVTASPRYGTWDPDQLSVGPSVDDVATLPTAE